MAETLKKYGVWIAAGALVLYLVYRQARPGTARSQFAPAPNAAAAFGAEQYRLESERLKQSGALDLERLRINANLEAERLRQAQRQFDINAQLEAARRARETAERGQTLGLIGQLGKALADLFKGQSSQPRGSVGTPTTFPSGTQARTQLPSAPSYPIPEPQFGASVFNDPNYVPAWPAPPTEYPLSVTDWGETPQFGGAGMDIDTGASFYDQYYGAQPGGDFYYGYGAGEGYSDFPVVSEQTYGYMGFDPGGYSEEFYGFDFGGSESFAVDPGGYSEEFYGFDFG
jgi:hypothetical protein